MKYFKETVMEKTIRHNIYAIAVISFCMGILYGMRAHAETMPAACGDLRTKATQEITKAQHEVDGANAFVTGSNQELTSADKHLDQIRGAVGDIHTHLVKRSVELAAIVNSMQSCNEDGDAALRTQLGEKAKALVDAAAAVNELGDRAGSPAPLPHE